MSDERSVPAAIAAGSDVAWCREQVEQAEQNDRDAAAAAAAKGLPAPRPTAPRVRAALEIYERTAVAHGRLAALEDAKEVAFSAAIDDLAGGTSR